MSASNLLREATPSEKGPRLPPTLFSPSEQYVDAPKGKTCTWQRIVYPTISTGVCITAIVLKALDVQGIGSHPLWGTLLAFGAGAAAQNAIQTGFSRRVANQEKSLVGDYITALFLITTQVYDNTTPSPLVKEIVLSSLGAMKK